MRIVVVALCCVVALAGVAHAQRPGPIPAFAADLRGFYSGLGQDPTTAKDLGVEAAQLPKRGPGAVAGVHVYLLRGHKFALGVGGEGLLARGRAQDKDSNGKPVGLAVQQRIKSLSAQISLNFGSRDGWSYLTAGMGPMIFKTYLGETAPLAPAPSKMTINMGAGARWFSSRHFAFAVDARFYQTRPQPKFDPYPTRQRTQLLVLSGGIAIR